MTKSGDSSVRAQVTLLICNNQRQDPAMPSCAGRDGGDVLRDAMLRAAREMGVAVTVELVPCMGFCSDGPNLRVLNGPYFHYVNAEQAEAVLMEILGVDSI